MLQLVLRRGALAGTLLDTHSVFGTAAAAGLAAAFFFPGLPFTRFWVGTLHMK